MDRKTFEEYYNVNFDNIEFTDGVKGEKYRPFYNNNDSELTFLVMRKNGDCYFEKMDKKIELPKQDLSKIETPYETRNTVDKYIRICKYFAEETSVTQVPDTGYRYTVDKNANKVCDFQCIDKGFEDGDFCNVEWAWQKEPEEIERQAGEELFKQLKADIKAIIEVECWKNETPEELFQWLYNKYNF